LERKNPTLADQHVGRRLRWRRQELKLSQQVLADRLGVTFQQVQKYENGKNRVSAGRLFELARALETRTTYFYDGMEAAADFTGLIHSDAVDLIIAFQKIEDPELRKSILAQVKKQARLSKPEKSRGKSKPRSSKA